MKVSNSDWVAALSYIKMPLSFFKSFIIANKKVTKLGESITSLGVFF